MSPVRPSAVALAALAVVLGCDGSPSSVDQLAFDEPRLAAVPNPSFQPFDFTFPGCTEDVDLSGTFHDNSKFLFGPNGKVLFRFHINAKGTGVGQSTGSTYQWNDRLLDITNVAPEGAFTFILNDHTRLIGQGTTPNLDIRVKEKVTVNANGDVIVDVFDFEAICR
ncbi:MAG: hypothetical protein ACRDGH_06400 [Candidatus Limnocylindria bacterium]